MPQFAVNAKMLHYNGNNSNSNLRLSWLILAYMCTICLIAFHIKLIAIVIGYGRDGGLSEPLTR